MIHDAKVEVTCDGDRCRSIEWLDMDYGTQGYHLSDTEAEKELVQREWIVSDGKHYCDEECAQSMGDYPG